MKKSVKALFLATLTGVVITLIPIHPPIGSSAASDVASIPIHPPIGHSFSPDDSNSIPIHPPIG
ncbi:MULTISPECIES: hypothetical protein [unclassified Psychrobacillus]|uniref:hypothetical protein n=1 Tax=unclassified Psychrobacillus TaxID=2636677 RepID=UPI0011A6896C|nr:hypothetical protein GI482_12415 [Bacillus sp. N3536]